MNELVFVVDDELHICKLFEIGLREQGLRVRTFLDGNAFLLAMRTERPDAVLLDWMMQAPDGLEITRRLREDPRTRPIPIILVTARSGENDRLMGLEVGADDYITKPFSIKEVAMRVKSVLRRDTYLRAYHAQVVRVGDIEIDEKARQASKGGEPLALTMREFDLLLLLMKNSGRVLSRDYLVDTVWGLDYDGDMRTLDVHIRYLRKKIGRDGDIGTVRGIGYRFRRERNGGNV
ncbi:response regulator transcription factor [Christensenellaceae bacterium OttesenSCG-928-L17]|nr:response regulator transcription factor [Christensenellaceae bacterium OttesenSCG-928-L17]